MTERHQDSDYAKDNGRAERFALVAALMLSAVACFHPVVGDDQWWHMLTGLVVLQTGHVPTHDPFSFTFSGHPWINWEWLAGVVMLAAWKAAGPSGLVLLRFIALGGCVVLVWRRMTFRRPARRNWSGALLLAVLALLILVLFGRLSDRPHVYAWPFLAAVMLLADRMKRNPGGGVVAGLAAVTIVWAMLHPSWVVGLAYFAATGLDTALTVSIRDREPLNRNVILLWLLTPLLVFGGLMLVHDPSAYFGAVYDIFTTSGLTEWKPVTAYWGWRTLPLHAFGILALVFVWALVRRPQRLLSFRVLMLALLLLVSLVVVRFTAIFAILAAPRIYRWLGKALRDKADAASPRRLTAALAVLALTTVVGLGPLYDLAWGVGLDRRSVPVGLGDYMQANRLDGNVYCTHNNCTSYLAFVGYPDVKVFIDGRVPQLFPADFYQYFLVSGKPENFPHLLDRYPIQHVVIVHGQGSAYKSMAQTLAARDEFKLLYFDDDSSLYSRDLPGKPLPDGLGSYRVFMPSLVDVAWWQQLDRPGRFDGLVQDIRRMEAQGVLDGMLGRRIMTTIVSLPNLSEQQRRQAFDAGRLIQYDQ